MLHVELATIHNYHTWYWQIFSCSSLTSKFYLISYFIKQTMHYACRGRKDCLSKTKQVHNPLKHVLLNSSNDWVQVQHFFLSCQNLCNRRRTQKSFFPGTLMCYVFLLGLEPTLRCLYIPRFCKS